MQKKILLVTNVESQICFCDLANWTWKHDKNKVFLIIKV